MSVRAALLTSIAVASAAASALAVPASAATLDAGGLFMLTGQPSLLAPLPEPVGGAPATTPAAASQDGRFVAFTAGSDGLSAEDDDTIDNNVYVKDRQTGAVTFASRRNGVAGEPSHSNCRDASISDDGTRVAFTCSGPLDPADTNTDSDVYVRDLVASRTILISRRTGLGTVGSDTSEHGVLSQTGRYVAFESQASLVTGAGPGNVYRREIDGGDATIVASRKTGPTGAPGGGGSPSISDDGNRIAFAIDRNGFYDALDTNGRSDVFVHDENADTTVLASRKDGAAGIVDADGVSTLPVISGNGAYVAFESTADQFDSANDPDTQPDIYRRSLGANATQLVNISAGGTKGGPAQRPTIDDSGEAVGWVSTTTALDPADAVVADPDVYLKSGNAGPDLVSRADGNGGARSGDADGAAVSGDGTQVAMRVGSPITTDLDPRQTSIVVRDVAASPRRTLSVSRPGGPAPFRNDGGSNVDLHLSADGRFAVFLTESAAFGLPDAAPNAVVVRDLVTDTVTIASREDGPSGAVITDRVSEPEISADGRRVAFTRYSAGNTGVLVYVRDLATGRTFLASRADGEGAAAGGFSSEPVLDGDGSRVAFSSTATDLGDGDTDATSDVHLRDLDTGRTLLVSRATGAAGAKGDAVSSSPAISASGSRVVFVSRSTNLGDGDTDTTGDAHLRDLDAGTTTLVSAAPAGPKSDGVTYAAVIDAAGTRVAFAGQSTNLLGLTPLLGRVFVRDLAAGTLTLASRADGAGGTPADAQASELEISPDGGFVVFGTNSTNLAPGVEPGSYEIYRRDLAGNRTALVSRGNPSSRIDYPRSVTNGGACVAFDALDAAPPLVGPRVDSEQGYVRAFARNCGRPDPPVDGGGPPAAARDVVAPVLSEARLTRKRFRVGPQRTPLVARTGRGTSLRFTSSEAAKLTLRFERPGTGRRTTAKGRRVCTPVKRRPKARACTAYRLEGTLTRSIRSGAGAVAFSGRINRRALPRGTHRITLVATDAAGNRSLPVQLTFRIVR